ncbi:MAG: SDR family NAD(P)-dependent oxidoreductase [SAR324 cluster bacterium]|nr:SDR family NAD(P)-dependent oxidoreductase [SAR324 cluster bacterium]MBL7034607.1 SDR family NAD(P)-dependent oxidoreductase [SAR324 cluster bacterium]
MKIANKKVIMISGANRGIGRAITEKLQQENYRLSLGIRNPEHIPDSISAQVDSELLCHKYDARDSSSAKSWIEATINRFGCIDGLINNAGILHTTGLEDDEEDLLDDMWEVNAKAPLRLTRLAFPHLRKSGAGRIVDIISMSGKRVKGNWVGYSMSKYAALAASHTARLQGWEDGIRVTNICTGFVQSDMTITNAPAFPQQEMTRPVDVAQVVSSILLLPNESPVPEVMMNCVFEIV